MTDLTVEPYSQLSYVVRGDKDKYHKAFHLIGGRWNQRLTNGGPGWIFASPKLDNQLLEFLNSCGDTYKFTSQKEVYGDNPDTTGSKKTKTVVKNVPKAAVNIDSKNNNSEHKDEDVDENDNTVEETKSPLENVVEIKAPETIQEITRPKVMRKSQKKYRREASDDELSIKSSTSQQDSENLKLLEIYKSENAKLKLEKNELVNYKEKMEKSLQECKDEIDYLKSIIEQKEDDKSTDKSDNSSDDGSEAESVNSDSDISSVNSHERDDNESDDGSEDGSIDVSDVESDDESDESDDDEKKTKKFNFEMPEF